MIKSRYVVRAYWDAEASCYWAESEDIPGLVSEAATFDELVQKVLDIAPVLLELNDRHDGEDLPIHIMADRLEMVRIAS